MKVLVLEHALKVTGHRLPYASGVAAAFDDCEVIVALPKQIEDERAVRKYFPHHKLVFYSAPQSKLGLEYARDSIKCLKRLVMEHDPDHIAIPTADGMATWMGLRQISFGNRWLKHKTIDICLMKGGWPPRSQAWSGRLAGSIKWWLLTRGPWNNIMLIDPRAWSQLGDPTNRRVLLCPDPVPPVALHDRQQARKKMSLPALGRLIVSVGNQDHRKGTDLLLDAFSNAQLPDEDRLLLIGKFSDEMNEHCAKQLSDPRLAARVIIRNEYVGEDELQAAIIASHVVAAPYRNTDRPSGIVTRSIAWNRPILGTNSGWLQWACDGFHAGRTVDIHSGSEFAHAIEHALDLSEGYEMSDDAKLFADYNTSDNYSKIWKQGLRRPGSKLENLKIPVPNFFRHAKN